MHKLHISSERNYRRISRLDVTPAEDKTIEHLVIYPSLKHFVLPAEALRDFTLRLPRH